MVHCLSLNEDIRRQVAGVRRVKGRYDALAYDAIFFGNTSAAPKKAEFVPAATTGTNTFDRGSFVSFARFGFSSRLLQIKTIFG